MNECVPGAAKAMHAALKETGWSKLLSARITVDDPAVMITRGRYDIHCPSMDQHAARWTCGGSWAVALRKVIGTIIEPKLGLHPKPFGEACFAFWMGGNFIKNDEPQGNQVFCLMSLCFPEVAKAMQGVMKESGS